MFADKQFDGVAHFAAMNIEVDIYDSWTDPAHVAHEYGLTVVEEPAAGEYNAAVIAVAHREFAQTGIAAIRGYCKPEYAVYDVKCAFPASDTDGRL